MGLITADEFERKLAEQEASINGSSHQNTGTERNVEPVAGPGPSMGPSLGSSQAGHGLSGSPLPAGGQGRGREIGRPAAAGRSLRGQEGQGDDSQSGGSRALDLLKQGLPLVQKLLPLLDGNILAAVGNLLGSSRQQTHAKVDLAPLENQLNEMQLLQHDLRGKVSEHNTSLKRVEDQLELVKEATDRNTMEQQEMAEGLRGLGRRVILFSVLIGVLLIASIILNILMFVHLKQVLP